MASKLPLLTFLLASVLVPAADNSSLSGEWQIHRRAAGTESDQTCTLTQTGTELTGSCSSEKGPLTIKGKVAGKKATWTYDSERDGTSFTVIYKGTIETPTKITGSVSAVEFGVEGEFTATRSK